MPPADGKIKWAANVAHVREVTVRGAADLAFWRERLGAEGLAPAPRDGRAQVLVIAAAMRFAGMAFAELSVSVLVEPLWAADGEAAFLVGAFNSSRVFAFCERTFFSTPYTHGRPRLSASVPLAAGGETVFEASMGAAPGPPGAPRRPAFEGDGGWEGPVYLPNRTPLGGDVPRMFFARVRGRTEVYDALAGDALAVRPQRGDSCLRALADSGFALSRWEVRADATHAKSKTYPRSEGRHPARH